MSRVLLTPMTSPFSDELISAYLDGELTAQSRSTSKSQLRESADAAAHVR